MIINGLAASPGLAMGKVRNVHNDNHELLAKLKQSEIVVAQSLTFEWYLAEKTVAIITDLGGKYSSVAVMSRSRSKPAVTDTMGISKEESTQFLRTGQKVSVDGTVGAVFAYAREKSRFHLDINFKELSIYETGNDVSGLIKAIKYAKSSASRKKAMSILVKLGNPMVVKSLAVVLHDEKELHETRINAAVALSEIASEKSILHLVAALGDWFQVIREKVSAVLMEIGEPAIPALIAILQNKETDYSLREVVERILIHIGVSNGLIEPLIVILENEPQDGSWGWNAKLQALAAIVKIGDKKALQPLIKIAMIPIETEVTCMAIRALGDLGDSKAVEPLIELLNDHSSHKMAESICALGKIGDTQAIEPLVSILENERMDRWVRDQAAWALLQFDEEKTGIPVVRYLNQKHKDKFNFLKGFSCP
jgi:HEAT repeat protein/phosphohistidine swiveling domain-containing protein